MDNEYNSMPVMSLPCQQYAANAPMQYMPNAPMQFMPNAPMQYMPNMPMQYPVMAPQQFDVAMPDQLENLYPKTHNIIEPVVEETLDTMQVANGPNFSPTQEQLDKMIDDVYGKVEADVYKACKDNSGRDERQFNVSGRRLLRDLIGILFIRNLLRRRPFYNFPSHYNPYFYGSPGFYSPFIGIY